MTNLHLLFNETMYDGMRFDGKKLEVSNMESTVKNIYNIRFDPAKDFSNIELPNDNMRRLYMKTNYPGLVVGLGYQHDTGITGDIKLGFSFDYVTGQPYIPGSSIKGVLKHFLSIDDVFKAFIPSGNNKKQLIREAFESDSADVVFLDAVIRCPEKNGRIIGSDFITPHPDPLQNPIPLQMVKVLPDVVFEFRFVCNKIDYAGVTAEDLLIAFKEVIETFGIGAKTNVGYGILESMTDEELKEHIKAVNPTSNYFGSADENYRGRYDQKRNRQNNDRRGEQNRGINRGQYGRGNFNNGKKSK